MRRSEKRKSEKKEDAGARKGREVAIHCVFPMICGSRGSKNNLAKAAGAEPSGQMKDEKLHALVARSTFPSQNVENTPFSDHFWKLRCRTSARRCGTKHVSKFKNYKTHQVWTTFGSSDVEKVHAVVARSTFPSQNVQRTPFSDHFWKLRCRTSARRCGTKHVSKFKNYKTHQVWTTFGSSDVEKVHALVARSTFPSQTVQSTPGFGPLSKFRCRKKCTPLDQNAQNTSFSDHFWKFRCQKNARRCGAKHISKSKCTSRHMYGPLFDS